MRRDALNDASATAGVVRDLWGAPARNATPAHPAPLGRNITWMFEAGLPDPDTFPVDDLIRITADVLRRDAAGALGYGSAFDAEIQAGFVGLRDLLAARGSRIDGRDVSRHNVMLTSGAAQGLMLLLEAFVDPGDVVAVEAPTWNAMLAALARRGASVVALPLDDDGIDVDAFEAVLDTTEREGRRLKLLYTIATFNTPTGVCLSTERRRRIVELARRHGFVVIEDNVYAELRYDGAPLPSLFSLDDSDVVVKVDSFSKIVAPGLRVGWITASRDVIATLAGVRGDLGVSQLTARVLAQYLDQGLLEPHIADVVARYRAKRDAAESALRRHCGDLVRWRTPEGGFFLWVELDDTVDPAGVMRRALERGVSCRAGERFFGDGDRGRNWFRLAFPSVPIEMIDAGIAVVGDAIRASRR
ncbi:MAG TPA: PLP-dependent aminotransferase family protein [Acidimicrobiales bacterium]